MVGETLTRSSVPFPDLNVNTNEVPRISWNTGY